MDEIVIKINQNLDIGCHPYKIVFNKLLEDGHAFGRSSLGNEFLQLNPTNTQSQNEVTLWHEVISILHFNLIGDTMSENVACALSEGVCDIMHKLGVKIDFSNIKEMTDGIK